MVPQQIFLSYCHRDDEPYGPQNRRWVEEFENALRESIGQRIGPGRVELWRDKRRLTGNELFDAQIEQQLDRSAIFITVLSQHYLSSAYCKKEFQSFGQRRIARGDLNIDHLSRIVKVYRRAIDRADLRRFVDLPALIPEVDKTVGFELYYMDDNGIDRDVLLDPDKAGLYWQRADDIAYSIKRMLDAGPANAAAGAAAPAEPIAVYLARTSSDMKMARESLQRELEDRGYRVLPETELPEDAEAYAEAVRADLRLARLSVHLIGARYGSIPEGATKSGVVLQTEQALAQGDKSLRSVLWSPPEITPESIAESRQREFVETLEQAAFERDRAEFVRSSIEQLKSLVIERLRTQRTPAPAGAAPPEAGKTIYLVCDPIDRVDAKPLQTALTQLGFFVTRASIEGTVEELLEENKAILVSCDVVVVVWGHAREAWVRSKLRESQQAPGWGRTRAFGGKFVVIAPPDSPAKLDFGAPPGVVVMRGPESIEQLQRLLQ
ncbi:MAG: toll/interleukin-1 receptor domain-containing protein [Burkholderiales bacterium]|nr:toll/interleukin-1 receptor domain-containing protein [Burkholderiales bacterium]